MILPIDMIFDKYDKDKNGTLDYKELQNCLQDVFDALGVHERAKEQDVKEFFKDYDTNHDGIITREDFLKIYAINFHSEDIINSLKANQEPQKLQHKQSSNEITPFV